MIRLTKTEHLQWNICKYTPFIYKYYADYLQYLFEKSELERFSLHSLVDVVYAETSIMLETENIDTATVDESSEISFSTAKQMVKINNPNYTGVGIKIGIIDVALPDTQIPFTNGSIKECYGIETEVDSHPRIIGSILGGNQGIASGADLYFFQLKITGTAAELQKHGMYAALDWMIERQINIINMSMSINPITSNYDGYSAYIDYCVSKYKFSFVKSAGNNGYTTSPGLGLNVITVGAINSGKKLWNTSGRGVSSQYEELICKPTLVAPGVKLKAPYAPAGTGTSYAAPIITGMIALLMEEFPAIRFQPEIILSVLVNGAETLPSQTSLWDSECGAGLANYASFFHEVSDFSYGL